MTGKEKTAVHRLNTGRDSKQIMIKVKKLIFNGFEENCYVVWIEGQGDACAVIDPGFDCDEEYDSLRKVISVNGLHPGAVLLTHAHPDHSYGVHRLCEEFGIPVYLNDGEKTTVNVLHAFCLNIGHPDVEDFSSRIAWIGDGDRISVPEGGSEGGLEFKVLFTPGHTAGGVCYLCREYRNAADKNEDLSVLHPSASPKEAKTKDSWSVLFSGDTLFAGCIGRSDLPGGDYTTLMRSILTRLLPLDGDIDVLPGHGHSTTIADERTKNPFLQPFNEPYEE